MHLEKTMKDLGNKNIDISVWIPTRIEVLSHKFGEEKVGIAFGGYQSKADYESGFEPIEQRRLMVPINEPEDGDEFTDLRPAVQTWYAETQGKAMALALKTQEWEGAVEK